MERHLTIADTHAQLTEAAEDVFLHLTSHARLTHALTPRSMRICIGREGTVFTGTLMNACTLQNSVIMLGESLCLRSMGIQSLEVALLCGY